MIKAIEEPIPTYTQYCYCWRSGKLEFGEKLPKGAIEIARVKTDGMLIVNWMEEIQVMCRLAYDNKTWLVPGVPEAETDEEALEAVSKFIDWLKKLKKIKQ